MNWKFFDGPLSPKSTFGLCLLLFGPPLAIGGAIGFGLAAWLL